MDENTGEPMFDMNLLKKEIAPEIAKIDEAMRHDLKSITAHTDALLQEVLEYGLFNGGKRFRPLLAMVAARLCGSHEKTMYRLAIAFEYLHAATLFHDDVIDRADARRGKPSVTKAFGTVAAILAGDFLHARAMSLVGTVGGVEALKVFCSATTAMVDGEFLQLRNATNFNQSEEDYYNVIRGKTALLIAATGEIGAIFAGGGDRERQALSEYGTSLGCAFQIVDDLLDYQGDEGATGKRVGNDLVEGKMTLPLILAMQRASISDRQRIDTILQSVEGRRQGFAEVYELIARYDGFAEARASAEKMINRATQQLDTFPDKGTEQEKAILTGLGQYVLHRRR